MRALLQRVRYGCVKVNENVIGEIGNGLVVLLGIHKDDSYDDVEYLAKKIVELRAFSDSDGKINLSAIEINAQILVVPQFTLYGDCRKGRRPSFESAASPEVAKPLYEAFISEIEQSGLLIKQGMFGASMMVEIHNDGPVTFLIHSKNA